MPPETPSGWAWLEAQPTTTDAGIAIDAAGCFAGPQGRAVLAHLQSTFLDRRVPPSAPDALLRHVEGQRSVVAHLLALVERGREGPLPKG